MKNFQMRFALIALLILVFQACERHSATQPTVSQVTPHAASAAKPLDGELVGEVFIVTQGAENIRLGLVELAIFSEDVMAKHIATKNLGVEVIANQIRSRLEASKKDMDAYVLRTVPDEITQAAQRERESNARNARNGFTALITHDFSGIESMYKKDEESSQFVYAVIKQRYEKDTADSLNWPTSDYYFTDLPVPMAVLRTDANGIFSIALPRNNRFVVVAQASRKVANTEEKYYWMVGVSLVDSAPHKMLLANHNLLTSTSEESFLHTKANALNYPFQKTASQ